MANRGEIAVRIIRACAELGHESVLAASEADRDSLPARLADRVLCIGGPRPSDSYLRSQTVVHAAVATGCDAIHPGYGFLSENADFAELCAEAGVTFIGPRPEHLRRLGNKLEARAIAVEAGVSVVPGGNAATLLQARRVAEDIGYPLIIKAAFGGGGRGMKLVPGPADLAAAYNLAVSEAGSSFGNGAVFLERYLTAGKHVEVQVARDRSGTSIHLGERDCSVQFRYQKVVEETPCPVLTPSWRQRLCDDALRIVDRLDYENVGTVEFLLDPAAGDHWFLEVNPRLQVEHPVTEAVTGVDLVHLQFAIAGGGSIKPGPDAPALGHAIECRITAQDPCAGLAPSPGRITHWRPPRDPAVRVDTHGYPGYLFPPFYDALLAKLVVRGETRADAVTAMREAIDDFEIRGVATNLPLQRRIMAHPDMVAGTVTTDWLPKLLDEEAVDG